MWDAQLHAVLKLAAGVLLAVAVADDCGTGCSSCSCCLPLPALPASGYPAAEPPVCGAAPWAVWQGSWVGSAPGVAWLLEVQLMQLPCASEPHHIRHACSSAAAMPGDCPYWGRQPPSLGQSRAEPCPGGSAAAGGAERRQPPAVWGHFRPSDS